MAQIYPEQFIQEVSINNDIVDIISEYVNLRSSGSTLKGLCPFHREKTPSFSVSPEKQLFYCFGCGEGGDVISFISKIENLDFVEAIKYLAEKAGVPLPQLGQTASEYYNKDHEKKQKLLEINKIAARFFYSTLYSSSGQIAQKYLNKRKIQQETIKRFGLGYSLDLWDGLIKHLKKQGIKNEDIVDSGLIVKNEEKDLEYDRFRNRLMFPIIDVRGNILGFGGRVIDKNSKPKYLNSPETLTFDKSKNLYGLNFVKDEKTSKIILVEGYMDVISLHQNGILNTVATLGTALSFAQAKLLKRYCREVIIAYDSDSAGQAATLRSIDILLDAACRVKVLTLEKGEDPDDLIRKKGLSHFNKMIKEAKNHIDYKIDLLKQKYDINNIDQKVALVNEMAINFSKINNIVERDAYIQKISKETKITPQAITAEVNKILLKTIRQNKRKLKRADTFVVAKTKRLTTDNRSLSEIKLTKAERLLINIIYYDKDVCRHIKNKIEPNDFTNDLNKRLANIIFNLKEEETITISTIISKFSNNETDDITAIFYKETNFADNMQAAQDLINSINKEKEVRKIKKSLQEGDVEKLNILIKKYRQE